MKNLFGLFLAVFIVIHIQAQDSQVSVEWFESPAWSADESNSISILDVIAHSSGDYTLWVSKSGEHYLKKVSSDFEEIKEVRIDVNGVAESRKVIKVVKFDERLLAVTMRVEKESRQIKFYGQFHDLNTLDILGDVKELVGDQNNGLLDLGQRVSQNDITVKVEKSKFSNVLGIAYCFLDKKLGSYKLAGLTLDKDLSLIGSGFQEFKEDVLINNGKEVDTQHELSSMAIDGQSEMVISLRRRINPESTFRHLEKEENNYLVDVLVISQVGKSEILEFNAQGEMSARSLFVQGNQKGFYFSGTFKSSNSAGNEGIFAIHYEDGQIEDLSKYSFPQSMIEMSLNQKYWKNTSRMFLDFEVDSIAFTSDDGYTLIGEIIVERAAKSKSISNGTISYSYATFPTGAFRMNLKNEEIIHFAYVPKRAYGQIVISVGDGCGFVFNDNLKNLELDEEDMVSFPVYNYKKTCHTLGIVGLEGQGSRVLLHHEDSKLFISNSYQLSEDKTLVIATSKNDMPQFGIITID